MALYISSISPPDKPVAIADCRIPCTVKNDTANEVEVKVVLADEDDFGWDMQPTIHYQNIDPHSEYSFDGFWDTLHFTPPELRPWNMRIELHEQSLGRVDTKEFTLELQPRPDWWGSLMDSVATGNIERITEPILGLFTGFDIEGFTAPPYTCFFCGARFEGENADDEFAKHLIEHIQSFIGEWFKQ